MNRGVTLLMLASVIWPIYVVAASAYYGSGNKWAFSLALLLTTACCGAIWWRSSIASRLTWDEVSVRVPMVGRICWREITEASSGGSLIFIKHGTRSIVIDAAGVPNTRGVIADMVKYIPLGALRRRSNIFGWYYPAMIAFAFLCASFPANLSVSGDLHLDLRKMICYILGQVLAIRWAMGGALIAVGLYSIPVCIWLGSSCRWEDVYSGRVLIGVTQFYLLTSLIVFCAGQMLHKLTVHSSGK